MPERIRLSRAKGYRKPPGAVVVSRPSSWGNPWKVGDHVLVTWPYSSVGPTHVRELIITPLLAVEMYRQAFTPDADEIRAELAGKDLCCYCPLDQPCHGDWLLSVANGGTP